MKLTSFFCLLSFLTAAQDNKKVMEPVNLLFDGMMKGDSAMVHRSFHSTLAFSTVTVDSKTNEPVLRTETAEHFLKAVGTPHLEVYNELIWSPKVNIDGNFAQVWVNYAFYRGRPSAIAVWTRSSSSKMPAANGKSSAWPIRVRKPDAMSRRKSVIN